MALRDRAASGIMWTIIDQLLVRGVSLIVQIILARILLPSDFGLIAMMAVFLAIGNGLVDSGMTASLVRTKELDNEDYSSVFFVNLVVAVLVYFLIYLSAPLIETFYNQEGNHFKTIIRVYSLVIIIKSFAGVQITQLVRAMDFKTQTKIQAPSLLIGGLLGIVLAYFDYGVWSIVWMKITQEIFITLQYFYYTRWLPILKVNKKKLIAHLDFGYKLTLSGLINSIFNEAYNVVIGKFYSSEILGYYDRAATFRNLPAFVFSRSLSRVTYPLFSKLQDDNIALKRAYKRLMTQSIYLLAPLMTILVCVAEPLFRFLLTEKWLPIVPFFQILAISGLFLPLQAFNLNVLKAKGHSSLFLKIEIVKKGLTIIGVLSVVRFGIYPLIIFQTINVFINLFINSYHSGKFIDYKLFDQLKDLFRVLLLNLFLGGVLYFLFHKYFFNLKDVLFVIAFSVTFIISYLTTSIVLKLEEYEYSVTHLKSLLNKLNKD